MPPPAAAGLTRTQGGRIRPHRPAYPPEIAGGRPEAPKRAPASTAAAGAGGTTPKKGGAPPSAGGQIRTQGGRIRHHRPPEVAGGGARSSPCAPPRARRTPDREEQRRRGGRPPTTVRGQIRDRGRRIRPAMAGQPTGVAWTEEGWWSNGRGRKGAATVAGCAGRRGPPPLHAGGRRRRPERGRSGALGLRRRVPPSRPLGALGRGRVILHFKGSFFF